MLISFPACIGVPRLAKRDWPANGLSSPEGRGGGEARHTDRPVPSTSETFQLLCVPEEQRERGGTGAKGFAVCDKCQ